MKNLLYSRHIGRRLASKMVFFILLFSSVITLAATIVQLYFDYKSDLNLLDERLKQIEVSYKPSILTDLWNMDLDQVLDHLKGIHYLPDIQQVTVSGDSMEPLTVGEPVASWKKTVEIDLYFRQDGQNILLGKLEITASLEGIFERLRRKVVVVLITQGIKTFVVSLIIALLVNLLIVRHIGAMAEHVGNVDHLSMGPLFLPNKSTHPDYPDEIDLLVRRFNEMKSNLQRSYDALYEKSVELENYKNQLEDQVQQRTERLRKTQRSLINVAHFAGMAEIANGILHNVGNLLNSINISVQSLVEMQHASKATKLGIIAEMLRKHREEGSLEDFIQNDPKAHKIMVYLADAGEVLSAEHNERQSELDNLTHHLYLMRESIASQQRYSLKVDFNQELNLIELIEDILVAEGASLHAQRIRVHREFEEVPKVVISRTKLSHALLILIQNAKEAMESVPPSQRLLTVGTSLPNPDTIRISICDQGCGIDPEKREHLFEYGFTTKESATGFGLHICATTMMEVKGSIEVESEGIGKGACFHLNIPRKQKP